MEAKDLILLMLIPILLIGLVVYTNTNVITGYVTNEKEKESNIIGSYSIMPSFKAKVEYDLNDYTKIRNSLDLILKCAEDKDVETCVKEVASQDNSFEWSLGCDQGTEKVLYDLAEFYQDCFDSEDSNCICKKDYFGISKEEIEKYGLSNNKYEMELEQNDQLTEIKIRMLTHSDLHYGIKPNSRSVWYPIRLLITYTKDDVVLNMIFRDAVDKSIQYKDAFPNKKDITLYKNEFDGLKRVDFVEVENDEVVYPNRKKIKTQNLHPCNINPKNIFKFCVAKKNSAITAYDKIDKQVKERHVKIKFASYVPDSPPPPLKVEVYDRPKAEKSVFVNWEKSPANDVAKYRLYYADSSLNIFDKTPTTNIRTNSNVIVKEFNLKDAKPTELEPDFVPIDCEFDYPSKKCMFNINGEKTAVDNNKLYYFKSTDSYLYGLDIPADSKDYDFIVTAIDKNNNEINNIAQNQKLPILRRQSIDDLPPDSAATVFLTSNPIYESSTKQFIFRLAEQPLINIDGSELKDFNGYKVYYKKFKKLETSEQRNEAFDQIKELFLKDLKNEAPLEQTSGIIRVSLQSEDLQSGNVIYFFVVAEDKSENPKQDKFKMKEIGAVKLEYLNP